MTWSKQSAKTPCSLSRKIGIVLSVTSILLVTSSSVMMLLNSTKRDKYWQSFSPNNKIRNFDHEEGFGAHTDNTGVNVTSVVDDDLEKFKNHLNEIHSLLKSAHERILVPWKVNENVSVTVQEDGFGAAMIRVRHRCWWDMRG